MASADHRFAVYKDGGITWKSVRDLRREDWVVTMDVEATLGHLPKVYSKYYPKPMSRNIKKTKQRDSLSLEEAYLIGVLIGDGSYNTDRTLSIAGGEEDLGYAMKMSKLVEWLYGITPSFSFGHGAKKSSMSVDIHSVEVRHRLFMLGLYQVKRDEKTIPEWVFTAPPNFRAAVARGLFDSDGGFSGDDTHWDLCFTNTSERVVRGLFLLLSSLGISSNIYDHSGVWRLKIKKTGLDKFKSLVNFSIDRKKDFLADYDVPYERGIIPPELVRAVAEDIHINRRVNGRTVFSTKEQSHLYRMRKFGSGTPQGIARLSSKVKNLDKSLQKLSRLRWKRVKSISSVGERDMYDIEIKGNRHGYIVSGILTHNSAADIVLIAMRNYDRSVQKMRESDRRWDEVKMLLQVHDEIIVETPEEIAEDAAALLQKDMEGAVTLRVPLIAEPGIAGAWADAK